VAKLLDVRWGWTLDAKACFDTGHFCFLRLDLGGRGLGGHSCRDQLQQIVDFLAELVAFRDELGAVVRAPTVYEGQEFVDEPWAKHFSLDHGENVRIGERDGESQGVGNVFRLKFGKAREAVAVLKESRAIEKRVMSGLESSSRVLTDVTGPFYTLVFELTVPDLATFEKTLRDFSRTRSGTRTIRR
jgi:hypothetical protein